MNTIDSARKTILLALTLGEQTEAYIAQELHARGYSSSTREEAICSLLDDGLAASTIIDGRNSGHGLVPALRLCR